MAMYDFSELLKLSPDERLQLAEDLVESVAIENPEFPLSEEQHAEHARRLAEHRADPSSSIPWSVVRERIRQKYGE